jgi:hypothetical protein
MLSVSVYKKDQKACFHIQLIDKTLKNIFSTEHIRYNDDDYRRLDFYNDPFAREVFLKMNNAIDKVLSKQYAIIKWLFPTMERVSF